MNRDCSLLLNDLKEWNIELSDQQIEQFEKYYDLLVEWNSFMNLTAITDYEEVLKKHFLDSMSFVKVLDVLKEKNSSLDFSDLSKVKFSFIDIGTGAGFPGIPLKILFPNSKIVLMDSLNKRINFLNEVISQLGLTGIEAVHSRAEDLAKKKEYREQFDFAVSRAVANIATLSEYCIPFVKKNGYFVSFKSDKLSDELSVAGNAIGILGGEIDETITFVLPNSDFNRNLLMIHKVRNTSTKYPRKAGLPSKEPLK